MEKQDKIIIQVDPELEDLIPGFLENRQKDIKAISQALGTEDFETVRTIGHGMKGAGAGYGFDGITDIGQALEEAAKSKDKETIQKKTQALSDYLDRVKLVPESQG